MTNYTAVGGRPGLVSSCSAVGRPGIAGYPTTHVRMHCAYCRELPRAGLLSSGLYILLSEASAANYGSGTDATGLHRSPGGRPLTYHPGRIKWPAAEYELGGEIVSDHAGDNRCQARPLRVADS